MNIKNLLSASIFFSLFISLTIIAGCNKKEEEPQTFIPPPQETSSDKEKELKEKEEFLKLKEEELKKQGLQDSTSLTTRKDSVSVTKDTTKTKKDLTKKEEQKKQLKEKEKELNKKFGDPKTAVRDYLEFIKRGVSEEGSFDGNMKKANEVWDGSSLDKFKANYKNTKKFIVLTDPEIVSQKGSTAVVKVKVKKTDKVKSKDVETDMTVTYNLVADANGKWRIKSNTVKKY